MGQETAQTSNAATRDRYPTSHFSDEISWNSHCRGQCVGTHALAHTDCTTTQLVGSEHQLLPLATQSL